MITPLRILVTGSRGWEDYEAVTDAMVKTVAWWISLHPDNAHAVTDWVTVVHGDCPKGADRLADTFASEVCHWKVERYPAQWRPDPKGPTNRAAGFERNSHMVGLGADICLCFAGDCAKFSHQHEPPHPSHGAQHCATLAAAAGIKVVTIYPDGRQVDGPPQ